ncbi:MAG TPA: tetratricopeptide repeat protein, partial [Myxococcota bacterium]|nr:tetratricopeptide repeat protein [Myxococcota bacterium]
MESEAAALQLCEKVGFLPLAIDLVAAMQDLRPVPESEWVQRLDDPSKDALEWAKKLKEELPTGCSNSIAEVFWQSLKMLKEKESWILLLFLAVLADAPVPETFLAEAMEDEDFLSALSELRRHSLVSEKGLGIHVLLRRVLLRMEDRAEPRELGRKKLVKLLTRQLQSVDTNDIRTHGPVRELLAHVDVIAGECEELAETELLLGAAHLWQVHGAFPAARKGWECALVAQTRILGPEHLDTLSTLQNLAVTLATQGDLDGARAYLERTLVAQTRILGAEHPTTLSTRLNFAITLKAKGDLSEARALLEDVLAAQTRILGREHSATLGTLQNLANTLAAQGDIAEARVLGEQAMVALSRILGPEHPDVLTALQNLAG